MTDWTVCVLPAALALAVGVRLGPLARPHRRLGSLARSAPRASRASRASRAGGLGGRGGAVSAGVPVALALDLVAAVLEGGAAPSVAVRTVAEVLAEIDDPLAARLDPGARAAEGAGELAGLWQALALAESAGLAPTVLVRSAADDRRRAQGAARSAAARRLAVLVVLPMGLCLLPAFLLLGVVPLVIDLAFG